MFGGQYSIRRTKRDMVADVQREHGIAGPLVAAKVANNTLQWEDPNTGDRVIRLHATDILRFSQGERPTVTLSTGGWKSVTTKDRMHGFLPDGFFVGSDKGTWRVTTPAGVYPYADGIAFYLDTGEPLPGTVPMAEAAAAALKADKALIKAYIAKLTSEGWADPAGDPWATPDATTGLYPAGAVRDWLKDCYVTRQLFVQALRADGMRDAGVYLTVSDMERRGGGAGRYAAGKVRRFLMNCLGHSV